MQFGQMQFSPTQAHAGGALTVQADWYLAAIVTAMFLVGCVLVILNGRERKESARGVFDQAGATGTWRD
jgi:hypothetical protein